MKKYGYRWYHYVIILFLTVFCAAMMFPMIWMFLTSFRTNADIRINKTTMLPETWTLEGYIKAFTEAPVSYTHLDVYKRQREKRVYRIY